jgi:cell division protein ZipA
MELREWLIILGLALVTLIVIDGVRRLKRQRRVPRLDQAGAGEEASSGGRKAAEPEDDTNWELPNGGARVVRPASYAQTQAKPKLERQEHPGPSRVLSALKRHDDPGASVQSAGAASTATATGATPPGPAAPPPQAERASASAENPSQESPSQESPSQKSPSQKSPSKESPSRPASPLSEAADQPEVSAARPDADVTPAATHSTVAEAAGTPADRETAESVEATAGERAKAQQKTQDGERREPTLSALQDDPPAVAGGDPLVADPEDHDEYRDDDEHYRLVDLEGMSDSLKSGSRRMGQSVQRFGVSVQQRLAKRRERKRQEKARREQARAEKAALEAERRRLAQEKAEAELAAREAARRQQEAMAIEQADDDDPLFVAPHRARHPADRDAPDEAYAPAAGETPFGDDVVRAHPTLEKALRHDVSAERARDTLSHADEVIVISVMSRDEAGFSGAALLDLMLACGLRYSRDMGIFHRFETEDPESELQFSMVNVIKPGTFPIEAMDDFTTPGVTLLMPLPGALDTAAAFEAMVETAMVIVRHLGGELKDENHSVMTAQTVEFARQRVQEFERRNRLNRYQVN